MPNTTKKSELKSVKWKRNLSHFLPTDEFLIWVKSQAKNKSQFRLFWGWERIIILLTGWKIVGPKGVAYQRKMSPTTKTVRYVFLKSTKNINITHHLKDCRPKLSTTDEKCHHRHKNLVISFWNREKLAKNIKFTHPLKDCRRQV